MYFFKLLHFTVGTYSEGNLLVVYEIKRQVYNVYIYKVLIILK